MDLQEDNNYNEISDDDDILDENSQIIDETKLDVDSDERRGQADYDDRYTPRRSKH